MVLSDGVAWTLIVLLVVVCLCFLGYITHRLIKRRQRWLEMNQIQGQGQVMQAVTQPGPINVIPTVSQQTQMQYIHLQPSYNQGLLMPTVNQPPHINSVPTVSQQTQMQYIHLQPSLNPQPATAPGYVDTVRRVSPQDNVQRTVIPMMHIHNSTAGGNAHPPSWHGQVIPQPPPQNTNQVQLMSDADALALALRVSLMEEQEVQRIRNQRMESLPPALRNSQGEAMADEEILKVVVENSLREDDLSKEFRYQREIEHRLTSYQHDERTPTVI